MLDAIHRALTQRRAQICARWEALLRGEPVASPLGHPDTLVFGIRDAVREIVAAMRTPPNEPTPEPADCTCGRNPLQAFYRAGEQALLETLVLIQAEHGALSPAQRDTTFAELRRAIHHVKHREIGALAAVCQLEPKSPSTGR